VPAINLTYGSGDARSTEALPGWGAFISALSPIWKRDWILAPWKQTVMVVSACTSVLFLAACVWLVMRRDRRSTALAWSLGAATMLNAWWFTFAEHISELRPGYYLWWLSFGFLAFSATGDRTSRRAPPKPAA
jgi:hypothetical protein